jgi:hypothetical protein
VPETMDVLSYPAIKIRTTGVSECLSEPSTFNRD